METYGLEKLGLVNAGAVYRNLTPAQLVEHALRRGDCPLVLRGMVRSALHSLARSAMSFCASSKFSGEMICKSGNALDCVLPLRSTPVYMILCRM